MNISKYFKINIFVYILAIVSIFTASFKQFIIITTLIVIHEIGHFLAAKIIKVETDKIYIYPLGGVSKFYLPINSHPLKELFILIFGPIFQQIAYYLLLKLYPYDTNMIQIYHYGILLFNFMPIYPLDGGKILLLFLSITNPYKKSLKITIRISYIIILTILIFNLNKIKINTIVTICFLIYKTTKEYHQINLIYEKFILERYLNNYTFKKIKIVDSMNDFFKNKAHIIKENNKYYLEKEYLLKKIKKIKKSID